MADTKKKYNLTVAPLWKGQYGGFYTYVKDEAYDALQAVEKGGMLVIREVKAESRKQENSPHAYLEYMSKSDLDAKRGSSAGKGRGKAASSTADDI